MKATDGTTASTTDVLFSCDTDLTADCVEMVPGVPRLVTLATYQLDEASRRRLGYVTLFRQCDGTDAETAGAATAESPPLLHRLPHVDTPGVLDIKWAHSLVHGHRMLGGACTDGQLNLWRLSGEAGPGAGEDGPGLTPVASAVLDDTDTLRLSLDWNNRRAGASVEPAVVVTHTDSTVAVVAVPDAAAAPVTTSAWRAHEYVPGADIEVWIAAFDQWQPSTVWTGGDDCTLKGWDLRALGRPTFVSRRHTAGVCSLHSHPHREHVMASGSYDEWVHVWDVRSTKVPLHSHCTGGGVWRLKWHPRAECSDMLLAACMRNGFQVLRVSDVSTHGADAPAADGADGARAGAGAGAGAGADNGSVPGAAAGGVAGGVAGDGGVQLLSRHAHDSLAYGVDWALTWDDDAASSKSPVVACCSFYDHLFSVWRPKVW